MYLSVTTNSETIAMTHLDSIEYTAPTLYNYIDLFELTMETIHTVISIKILLLI